MRSGWLIPQVALELSQAPERFQADHGALFEQFRARIEQKSGGGPRPDEPLFGDYATLRLEGADEREEMMWCRWVLQQLEQALASRRHDRQSREEEPFHILPEKGIPL